MPDDLEPDDSTPIVVFDRDEDLACMGEVEGSTLGVAEQDYLRAQGITDPAIWSAFRLNQIDGTTVDRFGLVGRRCPKGMGIYLPTFHPDHGQEVVGIVRLTPAQNKHAFVTTPVGLGCASDIGSEQRIVLVDGPLLGLRLAQTGVAGVAIVEDPVVLLPLVGWMTGREIVIAGQKQTRLNSIRVALGPLGTTARLAPLQPELADSAQTSLAALGLDRETLRPPSGPKPPITLPLLRDLHAYAVASLNRGEGAGALGTVGITDPTFAASFQVGFIPLGFREALSSEQRFALQGIPLGGGVIIPAFDEQRTVVDLLVMQGSKGEHVTTTLFDQPRGLVGAAVVSAFDEVVITDTARRAARFAGDGRRNIVILRGTIDAEHNVARLVASGVRRAEVRCWRNGEAIAAVLRAAGVETVLVRNPRTGGSHGAPETDAAVPSPLAFPAAIRESAASIPDSPMTPSVVAASDPSDLDVPMLVDHDQNAERAIFRAGDLAYAVQVPWDDRTLIAIRVSRGEIGHAGEVDVGLDVQRRRFALMAGQKLGTPAPRIAHHLLLIHASLPELLAGSGRTNARSTVTPSLGTYGREELTAALRSPDLLDRVIRDLGELGWHGEEDLKRLLFLVAISRKLEDPAWAALVPERSVPPTGLHVIAMATPPEDRIDVTRLTDNALLHADPEALAHKLLLIDDLERVTPGVATSLRVLRARGRVSSTLVERDPLHGAVRTRFVEAHGPVALIGAAGAGRVDARLADSLVEVAIEESLASTASALETERRHRADPDRVGHGNDRRSAATSRLHAMQRLVEPRPVVIPDAQSIAVQPGSPRARRDQQTILALTSASALLHQHQRLSENGCLVATRADLALAQRLAALWTPVHQSGLSRSAQRLLTAVREAQRHQFTMEDLELLLPGWTRHAFRAALAELTRTEFIASPTGGRGRLRTYHLIGSSVITYDSAARQVGELAKVGEAGSPTATRGTKVG